MKKGCRTCSNSLSSCTSAKPAARRAGMCDRREQIPQVRGYHSRFAPKPAAHFTVHNGSKSRNSVPLRNPPAECAASPGLLKRGDLSDPSHNGSKPRDSVPLRNPPAECAASPGLLKRGDLSDPSHNGSKTRDSVPLRNPPPAASFFTDLQETLLVTKKNCSYEVVLEQNDNQCVNVTCCGSNKFKNGRKHAAVRLRIECQIVAKKGCALTSSSR